jgi:citronellyl-CoA dehydrogenase
MWITNGTQADWICLLANTGEGPVHKNKSLICVPMKAKGVTIARKLDKLGTRSSDTAQIFFEDVRVPQRNRIGKEGEGFTYQMQQFQEERLWGSAAKLVALERHIDDTIAYAGQRQAFGQSILDNQVVHFRLAELKTEVELLRSLVYRAADLMLGAGRPASMAVKAGLGRELTDACHHSGCGLRSRRPSAAPFATRQLRRRRRRDHALHHLQAHGDVAGRRTGRGRSLSLSWGKGEGESSSGRAVLPSP